MRFYLCFHNSWEIWHSFSRTPMRNFLWCYYRWLIHLKPLKNVKNNAIFFKLFWHKDFVHWNLKLMNFLVDSVLSLTLSGKKDLYQNITKTCRKSHFIRASVSYHKKAINIAINWLQGEQGGRGWGIMAQSITTPPPPPAFVGHFLPCQSKRWGICQKTSAQGWGIFPFIWKQHCSFFNSSHKICPFR